MAGHKRLLLSMLLLAALPVADSPAGGGPENVLVVVNPLSDDSRTIANHYIRLRGIPASNVVEVRWQGDQQAGNVQRLRRDLLLPIVRAIDSRKLGMQIDCVAYSAGFPYRIDLKKDHPDEKFGRDLRPVASLTGATYLYQYVIQKSPTIVLPNVNWYVPALDRRNTVACRTLGTSATRAFHSQIGWTSQGQPSRDPKRGQHYLMSTMLGVTAGRGNTVEEVIACLRRAKLADHTRPDGTFYFAKNNDIRSKTRHVCYAAVARSLQAEGAKAKVVSGNVPTGARDIVGFTVGAEEANLLAARTKVLPGAICEHLTSFGGDLRSKAGQMPLSEFIRAGAAGASGTVTEPTAMQAKFPLPSIHLHYRRGCSLAEAFYQSISGPYQILIVGDPLCQPWATPPKLTLAGLDPPAANETPQTVSGVLKLVAEIDAGQKARKRPAKFYLNGKLLARVSSGREFPLDTRQLSDGFHELRVVASTADAIEASTRIVYPLWVDNWPDDDLQLTTGSQVVRGDAQIELVASGGQPVGSTYAAEEGFGEPAEQAEEESEPAVGDEPAVEDEPQAEPAEEQEGKNTPLKVVLPSHFAKSNQPAGREVSFWYNSVKLGSAPLKGSPPTARLTVSASKLGHGPVRLIARQTDGGESAPIWLVVK